MAIDPEPFIKGIGKNPYALWGHNISSPKSSCLPFPLTRNVLLISNVVSTLLLFTGLLNADKNLGFIQLVGKLGTGLMPQGAVP